MEQIQTSKFVIIHRLISSADIHDINTLTVDSHIPNQLLHHITFFPAPSPPLLIPLHFDEGLALNETALAVILRSRAPSLGLHWN